MKSIPAIVVTAFVLTTLSACRLSERSLPSRSSDSLPDWFVLAVLVVAFLLGVKFLVDLFRTRRRKHRL